MKIDSVWFTRSEAEQQIERIKAIRQAAKHLAGENNEFYFDIEQFYSIQESEVGKADVDNMVPQFPDFLDSTGEVRTSNWKVKNTLGDYAQSWVDGDAQEQAKLEEEVQIRLRREHA